MRVQTLLAFFAALSASSAFVIDVNVHDQVAVSPSSPFNALACGFPSGNCYENNCDGEKGKNADTCTGDFNGCPCGYGCGKDTGSCFANGCNGAPDPDQGGRPRCRGKFYGCDCNL